uniref:Epsin 1b n=1 Tax=Oryzias latipes TaxID=8090 RepID=A0A3B3HV89_ORYLA
MTSSMLRRQLKNLVQNYSEAEVKVREATSNDPWGPSSSQMADISDLTYNVVACNEIMTMLWKRLKDDKNWRHIHKSLTLLEYLLKTGDERVLLKMKDNIYIVKALTEYRFVEKDGKDQGANVREKAKVVLVLMEDDDKLKEERDFALKTREKTSKSAAASSAEPLKDPTYKPRYDPGSTGLPSLDNIPSVADLTASFAARKEERLRLEAEKKEAERRAKMSEEELQWEDAGKTADSKGSAWGGDKSEEEEVVNKDPWGAPKETSSDPWSGAAKTRDPFAEAAKTDEDPFAAPKNGEDPFVAQKVEPDPFSAPKNGEDHFGAKKDKPDPFTSSNNDPFNAPKDDPFNAPKDDPFNAPKDDPFNAPKDDPFNAPKDDPFNAPKDDPFNAPKDDPFNAPKDDPFNAPKDDPFNAPKDDPFNAPKDDPFNAPKDDPFSAPKDDPFNAPKDDPFSAPKDDPFSAPKDDPFSAPKDDPFSAPKDDPFKTSPSDPITTQKDVPLKTPNYDDPFGTPKDDPFTAPTTSPTQELTPKDDSFVAPKAQFKDLLSSPTKAIEVDPFSTPTSPPKEDPFSEPFKSIKEDPFAMQSSPSMEDQFTVPSSPPQGKTSDPFGAPVEGSPQVTTDTWLAPSAPTQTHGKDPWGEGASSPVKDSDPFGDASKPENDPWGAPGSAPVAADDAWGAPAPPSESSPSDDPFGDVASKSSDPWGSPSNDPTGKEMTRKAVSFLGPVGASLVDLDDLFSSKPRPHPLTDMPGPPTQAMGSAPIPCSLPSSLRAPVPPPVFPGTSTDSSSGLMVPSAFPESSTPCHNPFGSNLTPAPYGAVRTSFRAAGEPPTFPPPPYILGGSQSTAWGVPEAAKVQLGSVRGTTEGMVQSGTALLGGNHLAGNGSDKGIMKQSLDKLITQIKPHYQILRET